MKRFLYNFILFLTNRFFSYFPIWIVRKMWLKYIMGLQIGKNSKIDMGCYFLGIKNIRIGNYSHINQGCILDGRFEGIEIGNSVSIGHRVCIMTGSHDVNSINFCTSGGKIVISDFCFIGTGSIILKNVLLNQGCVVGAGAVVTKSFDNYTIVSGVPAQKKGEREQNLNYLCIPDKWFM